MLQRIYGTAWTSKEDLDAYLVRLEEAAKRDHRKLGKELDLFHMQEEATGSVFWHHKGWTIYLQIENYDELMFQLNEFQGRSQIVLIKYYLSSPLLLFLLCYFNSHQRRQM